MTGLLLGLDCGLTVTKAVLHDAAGRVVGHAEGRVAVSTPHPRWVERDADELWAVSADVIQRAVAEAGADPRDVRAVGVTGHGDGVYLVDGDGVPVRPAIVSLDTRAADVLAGWRAEGRMAAALALTGQVPWPATPAAVLAWLAANEPEALARAAYALGCKDLVRLRLTGVAATDPSEASLSFTDVRTQAYSDEALALYGLGAYRRLLPPVVPSDAVAGTVGAAAAAATGLTEGTPVVAGIHDVDACAIATGATGAGRVSVIAGSFSINQVVADHPVVDPRWSCRSFGLPGHWMHMGVSPASATNLEWLSSIVCAPEGDEAFGFVETDLAEVAAEPREIWYLPFLYGSPVSDTATGGFVGLRGWHRRAHLVRAVLEGVVFNHRMHVDALREAFADLREVRLTGGGARSRGWVQQFADGLGLPVVLTDAGETGALGAAMLAGIGVGVYADLEDATRRVVRVRAVTPPVPDGIADLNAGYRRYLELVEALRPFWDSRSPTAS